ncbi:MAG: excinuclease ABC subunit B, partial [Desulfobacteraceae bacterium]
RYLHSDITTLERMEIIRDLRLGQFDVLVGINLLREGLDIPEVSLVAILDADKEGFLRSARSLIQTCGRAARNLNGAVILYADSVTPSMRQAMEETARRRAIQEAHNVRNGITPEGIHKAVTETFDFSGEPRSAAAPQVAETPEAFTSPQEMEAQIRSLEREMRAAAQELDFERAVELRDRVKALRRFLVLDAGVDPAYELNGHEQP